MFLFVCRVRALVIHHSCKYLAQRWPAQRIQILVISICSLHLVINLQLETVLIATQSHAMLKV